MSAFSISLRRLLLIVAIAVAALPGIAAALQLGEGWTLTGNGRDVAMDAPAVFGTKSAPVAGISSKVVSVWKWDAINQRWAFFTPRMDSLELADYAAANGYAVLKTIFPGDGFWINTSTATALNVPAGQIFIPGEWALVLGWNLFATGANVTVQQFHTSIAPITAASIWTWNSAQQKWYFYTPIPAPDGDLAAFLQRQGYLDFGSLILADGVGFWVNILQLPDTPGAGLLPRVASVNPNSLRRGETVQVQIPGNGLLGAAVQVPDSDLVVSNLQSSIGLLTFTLAASSVAAPGPRVFTVTNAAGSANFTITVNPATTQIDIDPAPVVLAPGGSQDVTLRLGSPENVDHQITVSVANTTVASVPVNSVLIPAGQTEVKVSVTGLSLGITALNVKLDTLAPTAAGIYVTPPFTGSGTSYSRPVGVKRDDATAPPPSPPSQFVSTPIGILRPDATTGQNTTVPLVSPPVGVVKVEPTDGQSSIVPVSSVPVGVTRTDTIGDAAILVPVVSSTVGVVKVDPTVEQSSIVPVSSVPVGVTKTDVLPDAASIVGPFVSPPVGVQK
jgi:hypothetical protein